MTSDMSSRAEVRSLHGWLFLALAVAVGVRAGWLDVHGGFRASVLLVTLACTAVGFLRARDALLAAVLLGVAVPVVHGVAWIVGVGEPSPASFLAVVPALVGVLGGMALRQRVQRQRATA